MKVKERFLWIITTAALMGLVITLGFSPALTAQSQPDYNEVQNYMRMFETAYQFVLNNYVDEIPPEQLYEGAMKGLFESLEDPHSVFLTRSDMEKLSNTTTGEFGGVGLFIQKQDPKAARNSDRPNAEFVEVVAPIEGTPAYRAGIHAGDYIISIEEESTTELTIDEVVDRLTGEPGTDVTITILRDEDVILDITLTRAKIEVPSVKGAMMDDGVGYMRIIQWTPYTVVRVKETLQEFEDEGYNSLIVDVRGNPGGLLPSVVQITDFFLSEGPIVSTKSRIPQENDVFPAHKRNTIVPKNLPIAVLIDRGSASASEIFSGALKDTGRAVLIGETSFGKGSVQQVKPFGTSGFKMTTSRYYTPADINIDKIGIDPDITIEPEIFSDDETEQLKTLIRENVFSNFISENSEPSEEQINLFINDLRTEKEITLSDRYLKRLVRSEMQRKMDFPPIYDLEYDRTLQKAVETVLEEGNR